MESLCERAVSPLHMLLSDALPLRSDGVVMRSERGDVDGVGSGDGVLFQAGSSWIYQ